MTTTLKPLRPEEFGSPACNAEWARLSAEHERCFGVIPEQWRCDPLLWLPMLRECLKRGVRMEQPKPNSPDEIVA